MNKEIWTILCRSENAHHEERDGQKSFINYHLRKIIFNNDF